MVKGAKLFMLSLVCILLWGGNLASAGQTVVIKGSTTVLPVIQATAEAYMKLHPGVNISLSGGGSGETGSFIKFLLGEEGQKIVQREGFVPVKKR